VVVDPGMVVLVVLEVVEVVDVPPDVVVVA
jgi:hypothetical protein